MCGAHGHNMAVKVTIQPIQAMASGFFRANKYCAGQVGVLSVQISPQMLRWTSSCFECLTKPMEAKMEDAIQAMTCDMDIYYADVQL